MEKNQYLHALKDLPPDEYKKYKEYTLKRNMKNNYVHVPVGISVFPHNTIFFVWELFSTILATLGVIGIIIFISEKASV